MSETCYGEWFNIYHAYSSSSSPITHSSTVYIERVYECGNRLLSGKHGKYLSMDTDNKGSCERWKIKLVKCCREPMMLISDKFFKIILSIP